MSSRKVVTVFAQPENFPDTVLCDDGSMWTWDFMKKEWRNQIPPLPDSILCPPEVS